MILQDLAHQQTALLFVHVAAPAQHRENRVFYLDHSLPFVFGYLQVEIEGCFLFDSISPLDESLLFLLHLFSLAQRLVFPSASTQGVV